MNSSKLTPDRTEVHYTIHRADGSIRKHGVSITYHKPLYARMWARFNRWRTSAMNNVRERAKSWQQ